LAIKNIETSHLVHDLKNPANIIETGAKSLLEKQDRYGQLSPKQEKVVRRLLRNALRIKNLANSMLEVDMASRGITKETESCLADILKAALMEMFDLIDPGVSEALEEATTLKMLQEVLSKNNIFLEADESQITRTIHIDDTKMSLVLTNLLSNAFKYRQKSIFVKCIADSELINVSVKDDGPGIPESYHKQIFDQYFQCVQAHGFPVRGHGLGLAGAQALAEALGGRLYICKCPQGAEFVVEVSCSSRQ